MNRHDMTKKIVSLLLPLLIKTKSYLLTKPLYSGIGHILMFHRVCPKSERARISKNLWLEVTPEFLENIINFFAHYHYDVISLDQLYEVLCENKSDKKFVVFTFDDGYVDNFTYAYPIFRKYNIPFTIYVTTNFPDRQAVLWWYLLEDLILKEERIIIEVENTTLKFTCGTRSEKEDTFAKLRPLLVDGHEKNYLTRIHEIFDPYNIDILEKTDRLTLSWKQIEQLSADALVTIGAHTVSHYALNKLPESVTKDEILESKKKIEFHINSYVEHFAYPFGTRNEVGKRECNIVKTCGFKTATTTRSANIFLIHRNHLECLPRNLISDNIGGKNVQYLNLWINGMIPCIKNRFKRIVTI